MAMVEKQEFKGDFARCWFDIGTATNFILGGYLCFSDFFLLYWI